MKCNKTLSKWCKNKHGASKIIDTFEMYQASVSIVEYSQEAPMAALSHLIDHKAQDTNFVGMGTTTSPNGLRTTCPRNTTMYSGALGHYEGGGHACDGCWPMMMML
jgi:hypothetical protein